MGTNSRPIRSVGVASLLLAATLAGCASGKAPAQYAAELSTSDAKYGSPQCREMRVAAANYEANEKKTLGMGAGAAMAWYGIGIAAAGKDQQAKQRKFFARDMYLQCSSKPLPRDLQNLATTTRREQTKTD